MCPTHARGTRRRGSSPGDFDVNRGTELLRDHAFDSLRARPRDDRPRAPPVELVLEQDDSGLKELGSLRVADVAGILSHDRSVASGRTQNPGRHRTGTEL
jgi:hypothetical protein